MTLDRVRWVERRAAHQTRVDGLLAAFGNRDEHPVLDFLFTYYSVRPSALRRWHPGFGVTLAQADEYLTRAGYIATSEGATVNAELVERKRATIEYIAALLTSTARRPPVLGCFGLHEWAMVYQADEVRHAAVPLRLGAAGTDAVVQSMPLRCTHFDAYRFFTPAARPRNSHTLSRELAPTMEQPGCLHASMDLYKWASKLGPLLNSELLLDCFELAMAARELDMRASPYDLTEFGYTAVPIETAAGRAEYVRGQSELAERAAPLRNQLVEACEKLFTATQVT